MAKAGERKSEMQAIRERLQQEESSIAERQTKAQEALSKVQPILDEAKRAVGKIQKSNLDEIRYLKSTRAG